jgi:hypothetical protein
VTFEERKVKKKGLVALFKYFVIYKKYAKRRKKKRKGK